MKKTVNNFLLTCIVFGLMVVSPATLMAGVLSIPASALIPRDNSIIYDTNGERMAVPRVDNSEFGYGISIVINNGAGGPWNQLFYKVIIHYIKDCEADFNLDGDADGDDLSVLTEDYGREDCR